MLAFAGALQRARTRTHRNKIAGFSLQTWMVVGLGFEPRKAFASRFTVHRLLLTGNGLWVFAGFVLAFWQAPRTIRSNRHRNARP